MGVGYAIGFSLSGLKFGITLGLLFGLLNVVPYLGSVVGIVTTVLVAYLQPSGIAESGNGAYSSDAVFPLPWFSWSKAITWRPRSWANKLDCILSW